MNFDVFLTNFENFDTRFLHWKTRCNFFRTAFIKMTLLPTTVSQNSQFPKFDFQAIFISETKFVMKCCFNSVDENNYSKISVTIPPLNSCRFTAISCDSFTCNCNIRVLNNRDYIMLTKGNSPITIYFEDYTNLNSEIFAELLNSKLSTQYNISCYVDHCNR